MLLIIIIIITIIIFIGTLCSSYVSSQINFAPLQFSVLCIIICEVIANHSSSYSICFCSLGFLFLLVSAACFSSIIFGILSLRILFDCPNYLNRLSSITSIISSWTFIISLIFRFLIFYFFYLLPPCQKSTSRPVIHFLLILFTISLVHKTEFGMPITPPPFTYYCFQFHCNFSHLIL